MVLAVGIPLAWIIIDQGADAPDPDGKAPAPKIKADKISPEEKALKPILIGKDARLLFRPRIGSDLPQSVIRGTGFLAWTPDGQRVGITSARHLKGLPGGGDQIHSVEWLAIRTDLTVGLFKESLGPVPAANTQDPPDPEFVLLKPQALHKDAYALELDPRPKARVGEKVWMPLLDPKTESGHRPLKGRVTAVEGDLITVKLKKADPNLGAQFGAPVISDRLGRAIGMMIRHNTTDKETTLTLVSAGRILTALKANVAPTPLTQARGVPLASTPAPTDGLQKARKAHPLQLKAQRPAPTPEGSQGPKGQLPEGVTEVTYPGPDGQKLRGWLLRPPLRVKVDLPALVYLPDGFGVTMDDIIQAAQFVGVGHVVLLPAPRGANDNPGHFEGFYNEANDVIAAGKWLAAQDGIQSSDLSLVGRGTGGTLALLAAMLPSPFRALVTDNAPVDITKALGDNAPYDPNDPAAVAARNPKAHPTDLRLPTLLIYPSKEAPRRQEALKMVAAARSAGLPVYHLTEADNASSETQIQWLQFTGNALRFLRFLEAEKGCREGQTLSCEFALQVAISNGLGTRVSDLFKESCQKGHTDACALDAQLLLDANGRPFDGDAAIKQLQEACDKDSALACDRLGRVYNDGELGSANARKALEYFEKACGLKHGESCGAIGLALMEGRGVRPDPEQGLEMLQKSCKAGSAKTCVLLGLYHTDGRHVERNPQIAANLFMASCEMNDADGCIFLLQVLQSEAAKELPPDFARSILSRTLIMLSTQCHENRHGYSCLTLSKIYEADPQAPPNQAKELRRIACQYDRTLCQGRP